MVNSQTDTGKGDCLTDEMISGYLEGTLTPVIKAACEVHLISCDSCREKLATFMRLLQPDITPDESGAINKAMARWEQRDFRPIPAQRPRLWRTTYYAFAGVAAVLVVGIALWVGFGQPIGEEEVQRIFSQQRRFAAQIANQPYREFNPTRSPQSENFTDIIEDLTKQGATAYRQGRLNLGAGDYDAAVRNLSMAAADRNPPAEVLNDLGVAYFQRDADGDTELAKAQFDAALRKNDKFPPAVFNLALWFEREGDLKGAEPLWRRYLSLDGESGWAEEIKAKSRKDRGQ
jgi:tetratricopeptide (TPR) repeat protein